MTQVQPNHSSGLPGEIRLFPYDFPPAGWLFCDGQELSTGDYEPLFYRIGYIFGGSGDTFRVPDLRGRVLLHPGEGYAFAQPGGESEHGLSLTEMASHKHLAIASSEKGNEPTPKHNFWARDKPYSTGQNIKLSESALGKTGEGQPHDNMAPFLSLNYCIALYGRSSDLLDDDFIGMIRMLPYQNSFRDWEVCEGRELSVSQYEGLHQVIGNAYGGNGNTTFKLPDLRGRAVLGQGKGEGLSRYKLGDTGGVTQVTLTEAQLPAHTHDAIGKIEANTIEPRDNSVWANGVSPTQITSFATDKGTGPVMNPGALSVTGESAPHNNMMPYQVFNFIIALDGLIPERAEQ